jgi:hypothetical protein
MRCCGEKKGAGWLCYGSISFSFHSHVTQSRHAAAFHAALFSTFDFSPRSIPLSTRVLHWMIRMHLSPAKCRRLRLTRLEDFLNSPGVCMHK